MRQRSPVLSYGLTCCALVVGCRDEQPPTVIDPVLSCQLLICEGASECVATADGALCQCSVGYQGQACDRCEDGYHRDSQDRCVPDRDCAEQNPCGTHGACSDESGVIECRCEAPFAGPRCTVCAAPYRLSSAGLCETTGSNSMSMDAAVGPLEASTLDAQPAIDASADAGVEPTSDGGKDAAPDAAELDAGTLDASVDAGSDAGACTTEMRRSDFEALAEWPGTAGNCTGVDVLNADGVTVRSRQGDRVMRCAPTNAGTMNTRHIELTAAMQQEAELRFGSPISLLRMRYGARTSELRVDVWAQGRIVGSLHVPAWKSSTLELALDPPVQSLQLKSPNVYNQQLCLDDLEYRTIDCP